MDSYIRVSNPPPYGIRLENSEFRKQFSEIQREFQPDLIVPDPWNSVVSDDKARDFRESYDSLRSLIGTSDDAPALAIIHHTRKPKENEKHNGRALLNLFAGSYVFGSVAQSAFILQAATDDPQDNRVVWTCCKNNDGELGERTAWIRKNGLFEPVNNFDWAEFDQSESGAIQTTTDKIVSIASEGFFTRQEIVEKARIRFGLKKSSVYGAINKALSTEQLQEFDNGQLSAA